MLFTAKTLSTLEYNKIIGMLVECAATEGAAARAASLMPTDDYETVIERHKGCCPCRCALGGGALNEHTDYFVVFKG